MGNEPECLHHHGIKQIKLSSTFEAVFSIIRQVAYVGSIAVAAILVMRGLLLVGYLVACADYVFRIMNHVTQINNSFFQMQQQLVSGKKMMDFMNCESKIVGGEKSAEAIEQIHLKVEDASLAVGAVQPQSNVQVFYRLSGPLLHRIDPGAPYVSFGVEAV